jgi:AcrR family transcriptional regulator
MSAGARRGRPRDPALDRAVLAATAALLAERGYSRLRVQDVAERAGVGLGALYRRWPGKRELALAALAEAAPDRAIAPSDDPVADLLDGLVAVGEGLAGPRGRLLTGVLSELADDPELAAAVRERIIAPLRAAQRERLRRVLGDVPDLDARADLGPALVIFRGVVLGQAPTREELREEVLPLLLAPPR